MLASMQEAYLYHENKKKSQHTLANGWADFRNGRTAVSDISLHRNGEYSSYILFFYHSLSFT